ncbi:MAG: hypothetical protein ABW127_00135 [Candidatus Thiodiazotropha endolucinida]
MTIDIQDRRLSDLQRFYSLLDKLAKNTKGSQLLSDCSGRMDWPVRGVYFFQENGEVRTDTGTGARIVRVGTHALKNGSQTTLWNRLSQHKGPTKSGGGNHRGSIFRLIVGTALMERDGHDFPTWGQGSSAPKDIREAEQSLEKLVSKTIGDMPFLWLPIDDTAGPDSFRGYIERNAIALLSNYNKNVIDLPSESWLGKLCNREKVRNSGLWNQNHVDEDYDPAFLDVLEELIAAMGKEQ